MARFLKHVSCPECGSSDAKAIYDDGSSWCFSCKHLVSGNKFSSLGIPNKQSEVLRTKHLPDDLCSHFTGNALDWLSKTGISVKTLIKHGVKYSPSKQQIVFTWPNLDVWQARNCWPEAKQRYFTSGNHDDVLPIYYGYNHDVLVVTEDCLSAIKCCDALDIDAMPLLGSHLNSTKMKYIAHQYKNVDVFLDEDKIKDAYKIADKLSHLNINTRVFYDIRDPKHIPYDELKGKLK